jgi:5S rRNA maturation endonuclease (ribonuclease M5)
VGVSFELPYASNGLVLWYDAIYNGGFGVHNDNTSANKSVWKDLSGNGLDANLRNFTFDSSNGWQNDKLVFDYTKHNYIISPVINNLSAYEQSGYTIEYVGKVSGQGTGGWKRYIQLGGPFMGGIYGALGGVYTTCSNGNMTVKSYSYSPSDALFLNKKSQIQIVVDPFVNGNTIKRYIDGNLVNTQTITTIPSTANVNNYLYISISEANTDYSSQDLNSVRIYNRALSTDELNKNFLLDSARFDI